MHKNVRPVLVDPLKNTRFKKRSDPITFFTPKKHGPKLTVSPCDTIRIRLFPLIYPLNPRTQARN